MVEKDVIEILVSAVAVLCLILGVSYVSSVNNSRAELKKEVYECWRDNGKLIAQYSRNGNLTPFCLKKGEYL